MTYATKVRSWLDGDAHERLWSIIPTAKNEQGCITLGVCNDFCYEGRVMV